MRPTVKSAIRSYSVLWVLAAVAYSANVIIGPGANYLFLARPESTPSILDFLPPNFVLRTFVIGVIVTSMFVLSYLPWYVKDRKASKEAKAQREKELSKVS